MKRTHKTAAGIAAALSLGIAAAALAQPASESHQKAGMQHGKTGPHGQATCESMQKRAKEKGATTESDTHTH